MKTLIFFASPHKEGNTSVLLNNFIKGVKGDIKIVNAFSAKVNPCIDCKYCASHGECVIKNDDMSEIYKDIKESDVIVVASPIYFSSIPAPMKLIVDRLQVNWSAKFIRKESYFKNKDKIGVFLMTSGIYDENMFDACEATMKQFFSITNSEFKYKAYAHSTDKVPAKDNLETNKIVTSITNEIYNS